MAEIVINDLDPRNDYTAAGGELSFSYTFPIFAKEDVVVLEVDTSGTVTTLAEGTDYTVTGVGVETGGTIVLDTGEYPSGATASNRYVIYRDVNIERTSDFLAGGDLRAVTVNRELDRIVMMMQQLERDLERKVGLQISDSEDEISLSVDTAANRASKILAFTAAGDKIGGVSITSLSLGTFDTVFTGLANNDFFIYESSSTNWVNKTSSDVQTILGIDSEANLKTNYSFTDPAFDDYASQAEAEAGSSAVLLRGQKIRACI